MKLPPKSTNIRIEQRTEYVAVFFDTDMIFGGNDCFRKLPNMETARRFAAGEEIIPEPKKVARVRISERARYSGQDELWTERQTGAEILNAPITVYHFGRAAKAWRPKMTCFYRRWPESKAAVSAGTFIAEIPAGSEVFYFDSDEVRVDISQPGIQIWLAE